MDGFFILFLGAAALIGVLSSLGRGSRRSRSSWWADGGSSHRSSGSGSWFSCGGGSSCGGGGGCGGGS
ncbi:hypothetical protein ACFZAE_08120 [Streptomyces scabiei]|uniref:hypothetical protein n=1 Tax=Streptomyces TaxID=1883 RepID=UPI001C25CF6B|nr:hypothetical protein [Streptomyces sp. AC495_CC817]